MCEIITNQTTTQTSLNNYCFINNLSVFRINKTATQGEFTLSSAGLRTQNDDFGTAANLL